MAIGHSRDSIKNLLNDPISQHIFIKGNLRFNYAKASSETLIGYLKIN